MLFATVVAGRLATGSVRRKPLLVGMAMFAVGLVVAGTAEHMLQLVGGRFVQGLGSGVMNTADVRAWWPRPTARRSGRAMFTYISTAWVLPVLRRPARCRPG